MCQIHYFSVIGGPKLKSRNPCLTQKAVGGCDLLLLKQAKGLPLKNESRVSTVERTYKSTQARVISKIEKMK